MSAVYQHAGDADGTLLDGSCSWRWLIYGNAVLPPGMHQHDIIIGDHFRAPECSNHPFTKDHGCLQNLLQGAYYDVHTSFIAVT